MKHSREKTHSSVTFVEMPSNLTKFLRIHTGKSHKSRELPQLERIRDPDIVNSKHISPMKDVREEVPNLQVYDCDVCGEKFDTEDNLDAHMDGSPWKMCFVPPL